MLLTQLSRGCRTRALNYRIFQTLCPVPMPSIPAFLLLHAPSGVLFTKIRRAATNTSQELDMPCFMPCFFVGLAPSPCSHTMHAFAWSTL